MADETTGAGPRRKRGDRARRRERDPAQPQLSDQPAGVDRPRPARDQRPGREPRGLHDLVGAGPSQLGVSGALRGRDVNRPTEDDLAAAERDLTIVRRNWTPPA